MSSIASDDTRDYPVWVEFYGGGWDWHMAEVPSIAGIPRSIAIFDRFDLPRGVYEPIGMVVDGVFRMRWHEGDPLRPRTRVERVASVRISGGGDIRVSVSR